MAKTNHKKTNFDNDICMFVHKHVFNDSRVLKEAISLAAHGWRVSIIGIDLTTEKRTNPEIPNSLNIRVLKSTLLPNQSSYQAKLLRLLVSLPRIILELRRANARVYHGHDFTGLLILALAFIWKRPVVYDSHELFFDRWLKKNINYYLYKVLRPLEKPLAQRAVAVLTVSNPLADRLAQTLDISRPIVLQNAVDLRHAGPPVAFPSGGRKIVAHTGFITVGRHLKELVKALAYLPDNIALVLIGDGPLKTTLLEQARQLGVTERLIVVPTVPVNSVSPTLAQADCAAVMFAPDTLNHHFAAPNKFFEAVAAGVPLVYGNAQEISRLAREYDLGVGCDPTDPHSVAEAILKVLEPEANARYRANVLKARETLNWEIEEKKLIELYRKILEDPK